jgi:hypothetical protein
MQMEERLLVMWRLVKLHPTSYQLAIEMETVSMVITMWLRTFNLISLHLMLFITVENIIIVGFSS